MTLNNIIKNVYVQIALVSFVVAIIMTAVQADWMQFYAYPSGVVGEWIDQLSLAVFDSAGPAALADAPSALAAVVFLIKGAVLFFVNVTVWALPFWFLYWVYKKFKK